MLNCNLTINSSLTNHNISHKEDFEEDSDEDFEEVATKGLVMEGIWDEVVDQ